MTTPGKLELVVKINEMPVEVTTAQNGWKEFRLDCGGREVLVILRLKIFAKLQEAAAKYPLWVAAISGQMGQATERGFILAEPNVQVFERKPKAPAADASPVPQGTGT
jgi:hypothetical protein